MPAEISVALVAPSGHAHSQPEGQAFLIENLEPFATLSSAEDRHAFWSRDNDTALAAVDIALLKTNILWCH